VIEHAVYMWARAQEEEKSKCNVWHPWGGHCGSSRVNNERTRVRFQSLCVCTEQWELTQGLVGLLTVLGFELRPLCLPGKGFTTWATLLVLFALVIIVIILAALGLVLRVSCLLGRGVCVGYFWDRGSRTICPGWFQEVEWEI
jgi:hypothetical protein